MRADSLVYKALNVGLRTLSLAAKLVLTLYMGRYLGLSEMGVYGLVFGAVMTICVVLGIRLDFVVARELVGESPLGSLLKMRDQALFYGLNYILFTLLIGVIALLHIADPFILFAIYALSIIESLANMTLTNFIALGRPLLSTVLFFIRAGLWCLLVAALGYFIPATRTVHMVLGAWIAGGSLSLVLSLYFWRNLPWREALHIPVDWDRMKKGVLQSFPIWLGTIGGVAALHVDRFVVSYYLDLKMVGILTFFASFASALLSLVQSGFFAFSFPRLVSHYKENRPELFWQEVRQTSWQVSLFVFVAACLVGIIVPALGTFLGKTEIAAQSTTLWLMLGAVWVRGNADSLYYILYARHQDWANWMGTLLFLVPALLGNLIFVPAFGLAGVGYSAILAALFLLFWRVYYVKNPNEKKIS